VGVRARLDESPCITAQIDTTPAILVPPGTWEVDAERSAVGFEVRHLKFMRARGCFHALEAFISGDREGVASIVGSISVLSIDTGDPRRDARLCTQEFFDAEHHTMIDFSGVSLPARAADRLAVCGRMTMRGISRPLELTVERAAHGQSTGDSRVRAQGVVSRHEFGLDWDPAFAAGGLVIDDRVTVRLDVVLVRCARTPSRP
jgi:polyisoprenoid-binding protein YceI